MKSKFLLIIISIALFLGSCDDFGDLNDDPNNPSNLDDNPELLLTAVSRDLVNRMVAAAWSEGDLQAQYLARIVFTSFDLFQWGSESDVWNQVYNSGTDIQNIYTIAKNKENTSYQAVALILKSWMFQILTDMWGYAPYSEAFQGKTMDNFTPVYDSPEQIYKSILSDLDSANLLLSGSSLPAIDGDIIYDGDLDGWRRFANSLQLRALTRLSNVESETDIPVVEWFVKILSDPVTYPLIDDNSSNATLKYLASSPNAHPITAENSYRSGSFDEYRLSETFQTVLQAYDDPRIKVLFDPIENSTDENPIWDGMINGMVDGDAYVYKGGSAYLSRFSYAFYESPNALEGMMMLASEVKFMIAEAAVRYPEVAAIADAQTNYEEGITLNFDYWGVDMPDDYLTRASNNNDWTVPVAYDGKLETILTQKWIGLFYTDFQGFCEYKRTGYPGIIKPGPDVLLNKYPSRFEYPTDEQALNAESYAEAISKQGPDKISTPVWWENK